MKLRFKQKRSNITPPKVFSPILRPPLNIAVRCASDQTNIDHESLFQKYSFEY